MKINSESEDNNTNQSNNNVGHDKSKSATHEHKNSNALNKEKPKNTVTYHVPASQHLHGPPIVNYNAVGEESTGKSVNGTTGSDGIIPDEIVFTDDDMDLDFVNAVENHADEIEDNAFAEDIALLCLGPEDSTDDIPQYL